MSSRSSSSKSYSPMLSLSSIFTRCIPDIFNVNNLNKYIDNDLIAKLVGFLGLGVSCFNSIIGLSNNDKQWEPVFQIRLPL